MTTRTRKGSARGGKRASAADQQRSVPTGLFWPCPCGNLLHKGRKYALPIKRGPRCHFVRNTTCNSATFWASLDWHDGLGMTEKEATRQGYICLV